MQSTTNFRPIFLKKVVSHFSRNLWPLLCKKSQKISNFWKKNFFARNLKCLKICLQHHLCIPRQISGRYLSKKKLFILQEICYPGYAKKVKKFLIFEKNFSLETTLNALKFVRNTICAVHDKFQAGISRGRYLSKKKLVIFQEICDPGYEKK